MSDLVFCHVYQTCHTYFFIKIQAHSVFVFVFFLTPIEKQPLVRSIGFISTLKFFLPVFISSLISVFRSGKCSKLLSLTSRKWVFLSSDSFLPLAPSLTPLQKGCIIYSCVQCFGWEDTSGSQQVRHLQPLLEVLGLTQPKAPS